MKLGEHMQWLVMHYLRRYYLVPTNTARVCAHQVRGPRPGYFLAKNYLTSGWILMKLGEHLQ